MNFLLCRSWIVGMILCVVGFSQLYADASVGYVVGSSTDEVYSVNLTNGNVVPIVPSPSVSGAGLIGIALKSSAAAFITGGSNNILYSIDLTNGNNVQAASFPPGTGPDQIALVNNSLAYVTGFTNSTINQVNLTNGSVVPINPSPSIGKPDRTHADASFSDIRPRLELNQRPVA